MKSLKRWVSAIAIDAAMAALFYLWQFKGEDGAGNVFIFIVWFFAIVSMLTGFLKPEDKKKMVAGPVFRTYQGVTDTAIVVALAWTGHYVAAVAYLIGSLNFAAARRKPEATREATA